MVRYFRAGATQTVLWAPEADAQSPDVTDAAVCATEQLLWKPGLR